MRLQDQECPVCGYNDWYVKGKHRACRPCQAQAVRRYRERQALGQTVERQSRASRPLSVALQALEPPVARQRRTQTHCRRRHALEGSNVRWQTDGLGRVHRVCRTCHRERMRSRYGLASPVSLATMIENL